MCLRKAEIGQNAVTHESSDITVVLADRIAAVALKFPQNLSQFLGIEPNRQLRRARNVAEQDREVAPFRPTFNRADKPARPVRFQPGTLVLCRRIDEDSAVPKRNPELVKILLLEQHKAIAIDVVRSEQIRVLLQCDAFQPSTQVA